MGQRSKPYSIGDKQGTVSEPSLLRGNNVLEVKVPNGGSGSLEMAKRIKGKKTLQVISRG
jgi:hypothetical protein